MKEEKKDQQALADGLQKIADGIRDVRRGFLAIGGTEHFTDALFRMQCEVIGMRYDWLTLYGESDGGQLLIDSSRKTKKSKKS